TSPDRRSASGLWWMNLGEGAGWICTKNANAVGRLANGAYQEERSLYTLLGVEKSRQRKYVKDREATANGHLAIAARIPGKTDARLKIMLRRVRVIGSHPGAAWRSEYEGLVRIGRTAVG